MLMNMKEIARKAGVSVATVSYVLNRTGNVSDKTRREILQIIKKEGYVPNRMAKGLRAHKTDTIGVLAEDVTAFQTPRIINGINSYMESRGYHVLLSDLGMLKKIGGDYSRIPEFRGEIDVSLQLFESAQVDGIIYVAVHDRDVSHLLEGISEPLVYAYCYDDSEEYVYVTYDNKEITREAIRYLIGHGHRHIGVIMGCSDSKPAQMRFEAFKECMEENGLTADSRFVYAGDWEFESGRKAYESYREQKEQPTAVFAMNDLMALGFMDAALDDGRKLPDDVEVIGFDNRESCRYSRPRLTTVDLPLEKIGYEAGRTVLDLIHNQKPEKKEIILPCRMIIRGKEEQAE